LQEKLKVMPDETINPDENNQAQNQPVKEAEIKTSKPENQQQVKVISIGTKIYDGYSNKHFTLESFTETEVNLKHIPRLRRNEPKNETWDWDELLKYFKQGEVEIDGYKVDNYRDLKYDINILIRDNKIKQLQNSHTALSEEKAGLENKYNELEVEKTTLAEKNANLEKQYNDIQGELDKIKTLREKKKVLEARIGLKKEQLNNTKGKKKQDLQDEYDMLVDLHNSL
jgi:hypothetical protein